MNSDDLTAIVQRLRRQALHLRQDRNRLADTYPSIPVSATRSMRNAAQALDDAANDLLRAYGQELPQEAP